MVGSAEAEATLEREIVMTRVVRAPRELVWRAFTEPEQVAVWWGPDGFTNTVLEMDVRMGGVWRIVMHGPDGVDYRNRMVFKEVVEPERLVYTHDSDGVDDDAAFLATVTFGDHPDGTEVTLRAMFVSKAERDRHVEEYGAIEGGKQTLGRLAAYVEGMDEGGPRKW